MIYSCIALSIVNLALPIIFPRTHRYVCVMNGFAAGFTAMPAVMALIY